MNVLCHITFQCMTPPLHNSSFIVFSFRSAPCCVQWRKWNHESSLLIHHNIFSLLAMPAFQSASTLFFCLKFPAHQVQNCAWPDGSTHAPLMPLCQQSLLFLPVNHFHKPSVVCDQNPDPDRHQLALLLMGHAKLTWSEHPVMKDVAGLEQRDWNLICVGLKSSSASQASFYENQGQSMAVSGHNPHDCIAS